MKYSTIINIIKLYIEYMAHEDGEHYFDPNRVSTLENIAKRGCGGCLIAAIIGIGAQFAGQQIGIDVFESASEVIGVLLEMADKDSSTLPLQGDQNYS